MTARLAAADALLGFWTDAARVVVAISCLFLLSSSVHGLVVLWDLWFVVGRQVIIECIW